MLGIEREWHQVPGWYAALPREEQVRLMALWNLEHGPPPEERPKRRTRET